MPKFPVGDCRIGNCERPVDHAGSHGSMTKTESEAFARNAQASIIKTDPFESDEWASMRAEYDAR